MEIKWMRVLQWEDIEPHFTDKESNIPSGNESVYVAYLITVRIFRHLGVS